MAHNSKPNSYSETDIDQNQQIPALPPRKMGKPPESQKLAQAQSSPPPVPTRKKNLLTPTNKPSGRNLFVDFPFKCYQAK